MVLVLAGPSVAERAAAEQLIFVGAITEGFQYVLMDGFLCEDSNVVAEQVDCIEAVLPIGIGVLGVSTGGNIAAASKESLIHGLRDHRAFRSMIMVGEGTDRKLVASLLEGDAHTVPVTVDPSIHFSEIRCTVNPDFPPLPFIFSASGLSEKILGDIESNKLLPFSLSTATVCSITQLCPSGNEPMLRFFLTTCLSRSSCASIYRNIVAAVSRMNGSSAVQVKSRRNETLTYWCRVQRSSSNQDYLEGSEWKDLRQLIEDATGEKVQPDQLIGMKVAHMPIEQEGQRIAKAHSSVDSPQQWSRYALLLVVVVAAIMLVGIGRRT